MSFKRGPAQKCLVDSKWCPPKGPLFELTQRHLLAGYGSSLKRNSLWMRHQVRVCSMNLCSDLLQTQDAGCAACGFEANERQVQCFRLPLVGKNGPFRNPWLPAKVVTGSTGQDTQTVYGTASLLKMDLVGKQVLIRAMKQSR